MASGGTSIISEVLRRGSVPKYYCHGCKSRFGTNRQTTTSDNPSCPRCTSEFVEVLDEEEGRTVGAAVLGATGSEDGEPVATPPSTEKKKKEEEEETDGGSTAAAMETSDPQPEVISEPWRRMASSRRAGPGAGGQTSGTSGGTTANPFSLMGDPFVYVRHPRPRPFAQIAYEHIDRLHERFSRERDQREQQQQQQQQQQAEGGGSGSGGGGGGGGGEEDQRSSSSSNTPPRRHGVRVRDLTPDDEEEEDDATRGGGGGGGGGNGDDDGDGRHSGLSITMDLPLLFASGRGGVSMGMASSGRRVRPRIQFNPFGGGAMVLGFGQPGEVHGNSADYAWGPNGLDNVISQLLANLEDNGPPPAEEDKIAALPTVVATEEHLKSCADCSVCKEDFASDERLVLLPCTHLYHTDCIMPWLKLHDTCPTCRYSINTGKTPDM